MTTLNVVLISIVVFLILCPVRFDPAIRWKEYNLKWAERLERMKRNAD